MHPEVLTAVEKIFHGRPYRRVFVHGKLKCPEQLAAFLDANIECVPIGDLVGKGCKGSVVQALRRITEVADLLGLDHA